MLEPVDFNENAYYDGSRTFTWLADLCGLSVDLINFLMCQITGLFLASLYRSILHPSKVSSVVRHTLALIQGLAFGYFCFGRQAIHIAGLPTACYIVIRTQSPAVVQRTVMLVAMIYLLCIHLIRQIYDYGSYALDITGPLMIITQKVTSLAFSIHDGFLQETQELTKTQQYHAVNKLPSALEYFSYVLHFHSLMAGPLVFYKDYIEFIEGYNFKSNANGNLDNGRTNQVVLEPSPIKPVVKKVLGSAVCALIFMKFSKMYPVKNMKEDDFVHNTSIPYKLWYIMWATTVVRFKYYHAWLLADAICNNAGLGFNGYNKDGTANWDLISNINVLGFEFSSNMRDAINNWNIGTNRWLRSVVYERVPKKYGTLLTFSLSAVWHGFYPGYYMTFATGGIMVTSARTARRMLRHRFQRTQFTRMFYDILTCLTTRIVMCYCTFPFVLLDFMSSLILYLKFYCGLHVAALIIMFVLPRFIRGEQRERSQRIKSEEMLQNSTANGIENKHSQLLAATRRPSAIETEINANDLKATTTTTTVTNLLSATTSTDGLKNRRIAAGVEKSMVMMMNARDEKIDNGEDETTNIPQKNSKNVLNSSLAHHVQHDQCEMYQLSSKFKEKIDAETKNIEEFIDKTVTDTVSGIVGFKRDLMRDCEFSTLMKSASSVSLQQQQEQDGLRKRLNMANGLDNGTTNNNNDDGSAAFLKKEIEAINAVVQQANNMLPAVLSNGHAK